MLSGSGLEIAIAMLLGGAVCLGFVLHWLWLALSGHKTDAARLEEMAEQMHRADMARESAEAAALEAETALAQLEADTAERLALMQARLDGAVEGREADLTRQLAETKAEAEAMVDGLGLARQRILALEEQLASKDRAG